MRLAGIAAAACAAWCAAAAAQSPAEWARMVDAAKKEGRVVLYTSAAGGAHNEVLKAFTARYEIQVEVTEAPAGRLRERIRAERTANRPVGDLSLSGSTVTKQQLDEGAFQSHGNMPNAARVVAPFFADGVRLPAYAWSIGILVNTRLVKPGDEPRSWSDLLDPKWKGRILSDDYRAPGTGAVFFFVTSGRLGPGYHAKLAANAPVFGSDALADQRRVVRGDFPLYVTMSMPDALRLRGQPVKLVAPAEGSPYVRFDLAMMKNAPSPNAARLLMNWFLEEESQLAYARLGFGPTVKGVAEKAPPEVRQVLSAKLLGTADPARQADMLALAKSIYK